MKRDQETMTVKAKALRAGDEALLNGRWVTVHHVSASEGMVTIHPADGLPTRRASSVGVTVRAARERVPIEQVSVGSWVVVAEQPRLVVGIEKDGDRVRLRCGNGGRVAAAADRHVTVLLPRREVVTAEGRRSPDWPHALDSEAVAAWAEADPEATAHGDLPSVGDTHRLMDLGAALEIARDAEGVHLTDHVAIIEMSDDTYQTWRQVANWLDCQIMAANRRRNESAVRLPMLPAPRIATSVVDAVAAIEQHDELSDRIASS